ncbi:hypothetical protein GCM10023321_34670 [Pseudonocardia eucalypti]|uniref:Uncharacterized protein n=1 Tax=Pseudonocardia eucalypti TaxID=648755 RepID=A0ABP9Q5B6_9PSEU
MRLITHRDRTQQGLGGIYEITQLFPKGNVKYVTDSNRQAESLGGQARPVPNHSRHMVTPLE